MGDTKALSRQNVHGFIESANKRKKHIVNFEKLPKEEQCERLYHWTCRTIRRNNEKKLHILQKLITDKNNRGAIYHKNRISSDLTFKEMQEHTKAVITELQYAFQKHGRLRPHHIFTKENVSIEGSSHNVEYDAFVLDEYPAIKQALGQ